MMTLVRGCWGDCCCEMSEGVRVWGVGEVRLLSFSSSSLPAELWLHLRE